MQGISKSFFTTQFRLFKLMDVPGCQVHRKCTSTIEKLSQCATEIRTQFMLLILTWQLFHNLYCLECSFIKLIKWTLRLITILCEAAAILGTRACGLLLELVNHMMSYCVLYLLKVSNTLVFMKSFLYLTYTNSS